MSENLPPINPGRGGEGKLNPQNMRTQQLQHQHTSPSSSSVFIGHQRLHDLRGLEMSSYHDEGIVEGYAPPPRMMTNELNGNNNSTSSGIYTTDAYNHHHVVVDRRVVSNEVKVDQHHQQQLNQLQQQFNQAIVVDNNKNNHRIVISSGNEGHLQPSTKIGHVESKQENGKYTFHNTIVNQEKKKRKKREVLEGCNHFKIDSIGKDEDFIVENQVLKKRKSKKSKQVQVSTFEVLPTTDNNAMFGVFKKKPSQQSYEAVWNLKQSNNDQQVVKATLKQVSEQQQAQHSNTQHNETQIRMTPSPNHYPSSSSSSTNISQQATLPNYSNNNTHLLNGFNTLDHNKQANFTQVGIIQHSTSSNEITNMVDVNAITIGPSSSQPKRDLSNLNYGTITRSAHFQSATDMLFSEKQNEEPTEEGKLSNNRNDYSNQCKQSTIPSSSSSANENRNNLTESSTSSRTTMPSIKELFK